jgi:Integrase core domain.
MRWEMDINVVRLDSERRATSVDITDLDTNRVVVALSMDDAGAAIAECFDKAFQRWGVPGTLVTDNSPAFCSEALRRKLAELGVPHIRRNPFCGAGKREVA